MSLQIGQNLSIPAARWAINLALLRSGGGEFHPSQLAGLTFFFDAAEPSTVAEPSLDWTGVPGGVATKAGSLDYILPRRSMLYEGQAGDRHVLASAVTGVPFTVIALVTPIPNNAEPNGAFFSSSSSATANQYFSVGVESGVWVVRTRFGANNYAAGTAAVPVTGARQIVVAEWASTASRRIRVDGGSFEEDTNIAAPITIDRSELGELRERGNAVNAWNGELHRLLIYNRVLTAQEISNIEAWIELSISAELDRDGDGYALRTGDGEPEIFYP